MKTKEYRNIKNELQKLVLVYYEYQLLYLNTSMKENKNINEESFKLFKEARNKLEENGCEFFKPSQPQKLNNDLHNLISEFNRKRSIQEWIIHEDEVLLPPDSIKAAVQQIVNNIR